MTSASGQREHITGNKLNPNCHKKYNPTHIRGRPLAASKNPTKFDIDDSLEQMLNCLHHLTISLLPALIKMHILKGSIFWTIDSMTDKCVLLQHVQIQWFHHKWQLNVIIYWLWLSLMRLTQHCMLLCNYSAICFFYSSPNLSFPLPTFPSTLPLHLTRTLPLSSTNNGTLS